MRSACRWPASRPVRRCSRPPARPSSGDRGARRGLGRLVLVLVQPAGSSDRVLTRPGVPPRILPGGEPPDLGPGERLVAVDLDGREPAAAVELGAAAQAGLATALLAAGAERLRERGGDDLARLVPEYVTLPRGVRPHRPTTAGSPSARTRRRTQPPERRGERDRAPDPSDGDRRPAGGAGDRARVVHHALAAAGLSPGARDEPARPLPRGPAGRRGRRVRRRVADGRRGAHHDVRRPSRLPPPAHRGATAARDARPRRSTATRARPRSRSACPTSPPAGCTRSTGSGRWASGRATTATTRKTR